MKSTNPVYRQALRRKWLGCRNVLTTCKDCCSRLVQSTANNTRWTQHTILQSRVTHHRVQVCLKLAARLTKQRIKQPISGLLDARGGLEHTHLSSRAGCKQRAARLHQALPTTTMTEAEAMTSPTDNSDRLD